MRVCDRDDTGRDGTGIPGLGCSVGFGSCRFLVVGGDRYEWMDGWMDGSMDGSMDGWMDDLSFMRLVANGGGERMIESMQSRRNGSSVELRTKQQK